MQMLKIIKRLQLIINSQVLHQVILQLKIQAGPLETVPLASILSGSKTPPLPGVAPDEEKEKIVVQEKINKDVFDDVSRIVSFISVDGASNAALIQNEFITSFPQVVAISIQRL